MKNKNHHILISPFLTLQAPSIRAHRPLCLSQPRRRRRSQRGGRGSTSKKVAQDRQTAKIPPRLKTLAGRKNTEVEPVPKKGRAKWRKTRAEEVRATSRGRRWQQNIEIKRRLSDRSGGHMWSSHDPSWQAEILVWQKIPRLRSFVDLVSDT